MNNSIPINLISQVKWKCNCNCLLPKQLPLLAFSVCLCRFELLSGVICSQPEEFLLAFLVRQIGWQQILSIFVYLRMNVFYLLHFFWYCTPIMLLLVHLIVSNISLRLCSLFFIFFLSLPQIALSQSIFKSNHSSASSNLLSPSSKHLKI